MAQDFLPLCDVLFNIISLAFYFCDVVFDAVTVYTLYDQNDTAWFSVSLAFVLLSLFVSQVYSFLWYLDKKSHQLEKRCNLVMLIAVHVFQCGVLLRYFRLFIPVDLRHVKNDVRDLCMLRLIHAFCEAVPMLLIQLYLIWLKPSFSQVTDLNVVSTALSLFNVCWALASFNKNVRRHNVHRLVLTWQGVILQLLWRLGTVTSRAVALSVYTTVYGYWVFLVIALHWMSMFLWLISPKNVFHGEKMPVFKKVTFSVLIAFCYIVCYINLQEVNARHKLVAFYCTMILENTLLISVWLGGLSFSPWYQYPATAAVFLSFFLGIIFMFLYYRHFHVRRLKHAYARSCQMRDPSCTACKLGECSIKSHRMPYFSEMSASDNSTIGSNHQSRMHTDPCRQKTADPSGHQPRRLVYYSRDVPSIPGVFNCRFNPVIKRKKKKPTRFVPPPAPLIAMSIPANGPHQNSTKQAPFWKSPLPSCISSDQEGSVGSRVNIQQKLQEKKQQQIADLRKIEEEIRSGKLKRPQPSDITESGSVRQPIPKAKKQPWLRPEPLHYSYVVTDPNGPMPPCVARKPRSQTPEILLSPHCFDNSRIYYDYQDPRWKYSNSYHLPSDDMSCSSQSKHSSRKRQNNAENDDDCESREKVIYKSYRIPSDLDSQISLPRSYTLPREFKYYRIPKTRKALRLDHFQASTNSSDGDVDSCDDTEHAEVTKSNGMIVHPGHIHPLHVRRHPNNAFLNNHSVGQGGESPPVTRPPTKTRIHGALHRNVPNTHETKL